MNSWPTLNSPWRVALTSAPSTVTWAARSTAAANRVPMRPRRRPGQGEEDHAGGRRRQPDGGQVVEGTEGLLGGEVLRAHLLGQAQLVGDVGVFEVADRDRPQQRGHDPLLDEDREPMLEALDRRAEEGEGDPLDEEDGGDGAEGDPWRGAGGGAGVGAWSH